MVIHIMVILLFNAMDDLFLLLSLYFDLAFASAFAFMT
jgi:hypothetical protein